MILLTLNLVDLSGANIAFYQTIKYILFGFAKRTGSFRPMRCINRQSTIISPGDF